ncbi:MAG: nuclear transport factor 2 family protein [Mycobacterium sp.]
MLFTRIFAVLGGLLVIAASVAGCTTAGTPVAQRTTSSAVSQVESAPANAAPSPPPVSDEDQVRETVAAFQDAYNTQNWDAYLELMCPSMREKFTGPVLDSVKQTRASQGLSRATVTEVKVEGDTATATIEGQNEVLSSKTLHLPLVRADGWKICVPDSGVTS